MLRHRGRKPLAVLPEIRPPCRGRAEAEGRGHRGRREGAGWILETTAGRLGAATVVNAAGAWADTLAQRLDARPLGLVPHRRTAINVAAEGYDLTRVPKVNEIDEDFYFKPDAGKLLVSPADETPVAPHDAWPEEIDIATAVHHLTECTTLEVRRVAHGWAGLRAFAPDRLPVIGPSAEVPGLFWLAGLGGFGIQSSPAVGEIAAALLLRTPLPESWRQEGITAESFAPTRLERGA